MKGLKQTLLKEQKRLEKIYLETEMRLKDAPQGRVRISVDKNMVRYYYCKEEKEQGIYVKKENMELVHRLIQKKYDEKVQALVKRRLQQISKLVKEYEEDEIEQQYYNEHHSRQKFIEPVEPLWEKRLENWLNTEYQGKEFNDDTPEIYTQKGERVRSKSEKILADYFYYHRIPYKYECPLVLKGYGTVFPDFTFLSKRTGTEIYWEHDGMMDSADYARRAIRKIEVYEKNGIFPGERLILTFETEQTALNHQIIEQMVKKYLL